MRQRGVIFSVFVFLAAASPTVGFGQQTTHVALAIGNAAYPDADAPLKEPVSDARALGDALKALGFDVEIGENLKKEAIARALERFYGKITSSSTALIFFSGFGIQSDRQSYIIPVDAQIWNENDVRRDGFSLDKILAEMTSRGARIKIAIIDASRRNPFERRFRSFAAGLAAVAAPRGSVVMISAPPDSVVSNDSPPVFMADLIKELKAQDVTIEQIFKRTRMDVSRDTKAQQVPWYSSSLEEDFSFGSQSQPAAPAAPIAKPTVPPANTVESSAAPAANPVTSPDPEAEARHDYVAAENLGTKQAWDDFVEKHPSGYYYDQAREHIAKLTPDSNPNDLAGYYGRGQHEAVNGEFSKAISDFGEVIRRDPKHAGALNNRCWVRAVISDLQSALKDCNEALRIAPNYMDALDSRGMVNLKLGMLNQAISDYNAALQIDPKHASSLYGRGIAKLRSGNVGGGKSDINAAKAIQPTIANEFAGYGIK